MPNYRFLCCVCNQPTELKLSFKEFASIETIAGRKAVASKCPCNANAYLEFGKNIGFQMNYPHGERH